MVCSPTRIYAHYCCHLIAIEKGNDRAYGMDVQIYHVIVNAVREVEMKIQQTEKFKPQSTPIITLYIFT